MKFRVALNDSSDPETDKTYYELKHRGAWPVRKSGALVASVDKWKALVDFHTKNGPIKVYGVMGGSCALCHLFCPEEPDPESDALEDCDGCLVFEKTGMRNCADTPFWDYVIKHNLKTAKKELEFLESLHV